MMRVVIATLALALSACSTVNASTVVPPTPVPPERMILEYHKENWWIWHDTTQNVTCYAYVRGSNLSCIKGGA